MGKRIVENPRSLILSAGLTLFLAGCGSLSQSDSPEAVPDGGHLELLVREWSTPAHSLTFGKDSTFKECVDAFSIVSPMLSRRNHCSQGRFSMEAADQVG